MPWLVKARVRPGSEEALAGEVAPEGDSGGAAWAKDLRKALAGRARPDAPFYFPLDAKDPAKALGRRVAQHIEVLGQTRIHVVESGRGFDDEEDEAPRGGKRRPAPRRRRASEEDD